MASQPSRKPPAKKRPRLSSESSSSSVETNSPPRWDSEAVAAAQTASKAYPTLDTAGNPMLDFCNTRLEILMASLPLDLDWRLGMKRNLTSGNQRRAGLSQRLGTVALPRQGCAHCKQGLGVFKFCVAFFPPGYPIPIAIGACMNCVYRRTQTKCSFRGSHAPKWIIQWLRANNVDLPCRLHGPEYSTKWYKPPLDDIALATDINGMIVVRKNLRKIRARVAYDIKKLSRFTGDEHGDDDTGSAHARSENDGSEVDSVDVAFGVGSVDLNSDVVDSDVNTSDIDE
ncbi:hypothetical protein N7449_010515 [Penicillium cf. viridicatum]|uniref:Uncharacterized protein n=1 Tax=Penicillium cf. viridicatum TaxID=2972119 RepID=A0A9W9J1J2_9EURO|nr:hypothetical protein N7449_010515 [Penicillium cf. viridicatum]